MRRRVLAAAELVDEPMLWRIRHQDVLAEGHVAAFVDEDVETPSGTTMRRQYMRHPGAVGVIAWNDDDQIAVVRQYRHPVGFQLVEPPAGLLDHGAEVFLDAVQRELAEEAGLAARRWQVLVDIFTSPGGSEESLRVYLARDLSDVGRPDGFEPEGEEAEMDVCWAARSDLVDAIYAGQVQNPTMVSGVLALEAARLGGRLDALRTADAPWPARVVRAERHGDRG